jgi:hypothetical protein
MEFLIPTSTDSIVEFLVQFAMAARELSTTPFDWFTPPKFILETNRTFGGATG